MEVKEYSPEKNISLEQIKIWAKHIAINLKNKTKDLNKATTFIKQELISNIQELGEDTARPQEMKHDVAEPRKQIFHWQQP